MGQMLVEAPAMNSKSLLGHLGQLRDDPIGLLMSALGQKEPIVRLRLGHIKGFFLFDPALIRRVLIDDSQHFSKAVRSYEKARLLVGNGLVTSGGNFWRSQRRIAQPAFHRRCIEGFADSMVNAAWEQCEQWQSDAIGKSSFDMAKAINQLTLRIAGETLMGTGLTEEGRAVGQALDVFMERFNQILNSPLPWAEHWPTRANRKMWRAIKSLHGMTDSIIEKRRSTGAEIPDLLGMFMNAEDPESGARMDDRQLRDEVLTMLLAGHETTANSLTWVLYLLAKNPAVLGQCAAEVDKVLGRRRMVVSDLESLPFMKQIIQEGLRLFPPVWIVVRKAEKECALGNVRIPKGSYVFISQYAMHRHPDYWTDPEAFDPDRFGSDQAIVDKYVYFPFLRGQRQCIGERFANMELALLLTTFVQNMHFEVVPEQRVELEPSVTLRPKFGLEMRVSPRAS